MTKSFKRKSAEGGNAGRFSEVVGMNSLASGVYSYRLKVRENDGRKIVSVRKLMLMK